LKSGKVIWDWLPIQDEIKPSGMIYGLGSLSMEIPAEMFKLFKEKYASLILVSGEWGRLAKNQTMAEADIFANELIKLGVPSDSILAENQSSNTGQNIERSKRILKKAGYKLNDAIAVTTPWLSRRQKASLEKQWTSISWAIHTPKPINYEDRIASTNSDEFLNLIVGEIERLKKYPSKGFTKYVEIPKSVLDAQEILINSGYTKQMPSVE